MRDGQLAYRDLGNRVDWFCATDDEHWEIRMEHFKRFPDGPMPMPVNHSIFHQCGVKIEEGRG